VTVGPEIRGQTELAQRYGLTGLPPSWWHTPWALLHLRDEYRPRWERTLRGDPCAYCGGPGGTLDHIEPTAEGGANRMANLTGACDRCNQAKGTTSLLAFLLERTR